MATPVQGAATPIPAHPDHLAHRLHRALSGLAQFTDSLGDDLIQLDRNDLWAVFALLADEAERVYEATLAD